MLSILAALSLVSAQSAPAATPVLTPPQAEALRCGVVFALVTRMQREGKGAGAAPGWPPLGTRGKEYFVRVTARLMEDTGATRDTISAIAAQEVPALQAEGVLDAARPACLSLLAASGL